MGSRSGLGAVRPLWPALVLALAVAGCGGEGRAEPTGECGDALVVATTTILGDVARQVVGDHGRVEVLMPVGADPHSFQASAAQAASLRQADLVITNGLGLEGGLHDVVAAAAAEGVAVVEAASFVEPLPFEIGEHDHEGEGHEHEREGHEHEGEGHEHHDHTLAHACGHFDDEPLGVADGGSINDDHTRYVVDLGGGFAEVTFDRGEDGSVSFFLGSEVSMSVTDGAGNVVAAESETPVGDECAAVAVVATSDLASGLYTIAFGPGAQEASVDLVWEAAGGHEHDHEGEGHDHEGEGHDHEGEGHEHHDHGSLDPHIWTDPARMAEVATGLGEALAAARPACAAAYRAAAAAYAGELLGLDAEIEATLAAVPPEQRKLLTNHHALGYFADRYGFEVIGAIIPGGATLAEPSAADLAGLVDLLRRAGVRAIFAETTRPAGLAEALAAELGGRVAVVSLYTGSLGEPGSGADTYPGMQRTNAERIAAALVP